MKNNIILRGGTSNYQEIIYDIAKNNNYKTYLEIGTWNGLGSTRCFVEGFKNRTTDFVFYYTTYDKYNLKYSNILPDVNEFNIDTINKTIIIT